MKFIEFKNVSKNFNDNNEDVKALKKVSFDIKKNELVVITGNTNAGKTTILNLIGGLQKASSGEVLINGENLTNLKENKLSKYRKDNVGFVFQSCDLFENLTVLENILIGDSKSENSLKAKELIKKTHLTKKMDKYPGDLSFCEKQLVCILRAIIKKPKILLCDEAFTYLDEKTTKCVLNLIQQMMKKCKTTVIIASHNKAILPIANKVISLDSGNLKAIKINKKTKEIKDIKC